MKLTRLQKTIQESVVYSNFIDRVQRIITRL